MRRKSRHGLHMATARWRHPKGPCAQIVYTLGPIPMYLYREYFKAKVYTIWVHGPLGTGSRPEP